MVILQSNLLRNLFEIGNLNKSKANKNKRENTGDLRNRKMSEEKSTLRAPILNRKLKTTSYFLTWDRIFEALVAAKVFGSDLPPKTKFIKKYQDLEGIPEGTATEKRLKEAVREKKSAMVYLNRSMDSDKATGYLAKACDDN